MNRAEISHAVSQVFQDLGKASEERSNYLQKAKAKNAWFSIENLEYCLNHWSKLLTASNLESWAGRYTDVHSPKKIGIVMAGNVPMVGWHDLLSVIISGHSAVVKLSSDDEVLIPFIVEKLKQVEPGFDDRIEFVERIKNVDAVIATGSNNSARYFEQYFGHLPNIIRKNRSSMAIIDGTESPEQLFALGEDIYRYFGLGCRNVSCIAIPSDYNLSTLLYPLEPYVTVMDHHKYANNYTYHKAIWLMDNLPHYDNGFMCFRKEKALHAPLSTMNYWRYESRVELQDYIAQNKNDLQCIVGINTEHAEVQPGQSQFPKLDDYADKVDVMAFLQEL